MLAVISRFLVVSLLVTLGGCAHRMDMGPQRAAPPQERPTTPPPPASNDNTARVHFDATGGPMRVTAQPVDRAAGVRELCVTPCWAELPPGHWELFLSTTNIDEELSRGDSDEIHLGPGVWAYRRAPMIKREPSTAMNIFAGILGSLALNAVVLGPMFAAIDDDPAPWIGLTVAGLGLGVVSLLLVQIDTDVEPGATTLWSLSEER